jgi:hypothetical protein
MTDERRYPWGSTIAWMRQGSPKWTCVHRVFDGKVTFCLRPIPSPSEVHGIGTGRPTMGKCSRCETLHARAQVYRESEILRSGR